MCMYCMLCVRVCVCVCVCVCVFLDHSLFSVHIILFIEFFCSLCFVEFKMTAECMIMVSKTLQSSVL